MCSLLIEEVCERAIILFASHFRIFDVHCKFLMSFEPMIFIWQMEKERTEIKYKIWAGNKTRRNDIAVEGGRVGEDGIWTRDCLWRYLHMRIHLHIFTLFTIVFVCLRVYMGQLSFVAVGLPFSYQPHFFPFFDIHIWSALSVWFISMLHSLLKLYHCTFTKGMNLEELSCKLIKIVIYFIVCN